MHDNRKKNSFKNFKPTAHGNWGRRIIKFVVALKFLGKKIKSYDNCFLLATQL